MQWKMLEDEAAIEVWRGDAPAASIIWLHGLGADGSDFVPLIPALGLPDTLAVRFIFPHAPVQPVTCNGGYEMRAWYDIISLERHERRIDEAGLAASAARVAALIDREQARGVPAGRIVLAGFSQGGAVAYVSALTYPERLAGILALSTYLPAPERSVAARSPANADLPVWVAHGEEDDVVDLALGRQAADWLTAEAYPVSWQTYPLAHEVSAEEIADAGRWLAERLA